MSSKRRVRLKKGGTGRGFGSAATRPAKPRTVRLRNPDGTGHRTLSVPEALGEAAALHRRGQLAEAEKTYRSILSVDRANFDALHLLGVTRHQQGDPRQAAKLIKAAIRRFDGHAEAHNNLGGALNDLGRHDEAVACYRQALDIRPDYAEALNHIGIALCALAKNTEAAACARRALEIHPGFAEAHFTWGDALHGQGDYDAAFDHYITGNALVHAEEDGDQSAWLEDRFEPTAAVFDSAFFAERWAHGDDSTRPVFVVGPPRSGKTTVENILSRHPEIAAAGERADFPRIVSLIRANTGLAESYPYCVAELDPGTIRGLARGHLDRLDEIDPRARRVVDTLPTNFARIGLIALLFPDARIINACRDPIENCLRCYFKIFQREWKGMWDFKDIAEYHKIYRRYMDHWRAVRPIEILDVQFEELAADPEPVARRMIDFIGLEWDDRCLGNDGADPAGQTIYSKPVSVAKHYQKHLGPLIEALKD